MNGYLANAKKRSPGEIFEDEIAKTRKELPFSLSVKDIARLARVSQNTVYQKLERGEIPGANKLMGQWRIPRDRFLSWFYQMEG